MQNAVLIYRNGIFYLYDGKNYSKNRSVIDPDEPVLLKEYEYKTIRYNEADYTVGEAKMIEHIIYNDWLALADINNIVYLVDTIIKPH